MKQKMITLWAGFKAASFTEKCEKLAFLCLCLLVFDLSFSGGGHYLKFGSLTIRMVAALLAFVFCIPKFLKEFKRFITNPILLLFAAYLIYLAVCAVRGYRSGNRMNVLMSDLKGFAWLFLVPVFMAVVRKRSRFRVMLNAIMLGAAVQAVLVLVVNAVCALVHEGIVYFYQPFLDMKIGIINNITASCVRIFMSSCPYMVFACSIAVFRQVQEKKLCIHYVALIALCLCAILLSFTRSLYGCTFVVVLCALAAVIWFYRKEWKKLLRFVALCLAVTLCLVFIMEFAYNSTYLNFAVARTLGAEPRESFAVSLRRSTGRLLADIRQGTTSTDITQPETDPDATEEPTVEPTEESEKDLEKQKKYMDLTALSDSLRIVTQSELVVLIRANPIFGNGLGACAPSRVSGCNLPSDGLDEYFYLDMLARTGVMGLVLYLLPFGWILLECFKNRGKLKQFPDGVAAICGIVGFWAITWFNPWMNAVLGIAAYALLCALPETLHTEDDIVPYVE